MKGRSTQAFFPDGDAQGFHGGVHMIDAVGLLDGAFGEEIRFALQLPVFIQDLQGAEQIIAVVIGKGQAVTPVVDEAILGGESVIEPV